MAASAEERLKKIIAEQLTHDPSRLRIAIVESVRTRVESKLNLRTIRRGRVRERARVPSHLLARFQDLEGEAPLAREVAGRESGRSASQDQ